jgi:hypothetical protein
MLDSSTPNFHSTNYWQLAVSLTFIGAKGITLSHDVGL